MGAFCLSLLELDVELHALPPTAEVISDLMRARGVTLAECLQEVPARMHDAVEHGVFRGASVALAAAQVRSGVDLRGQVGFPDGQGVVDYEDLADGFEDAAEAIIAEVPAEQILREGH